jgi:serine/threonine protein kinase
VGMDTVKMDSPMPEEKKCPQCGAPLPPNAPAGLCPICLLKIGASETVTDAKQNSFTPPAIAELAPLFPQLEILELIGKGGMGAVYKARQKQLDRIVALKILPPGIGNDPAFAERFAREAKALAKLNHPNIVTLYEFGDVKNSDASRLFYFFMEFVDGVNLRQLLHAGRISPREALAIVPQICDALQFAHDHGIVHRDIKPENILLDRRGRVKVADFGLAKIVDATLTPSLSHPMGEGGATAPGEGKPTLTESGKVMGTPNYMSPEQKENPGDVDHRADIYALGVVFYQMLTGELPGKKIEPPSKKVHIDVRLDEIVLRALEKNPDLRYSQASQFKTQIETVAESSQFTENSNRESKSFARFDKKDAEYFFTGLCGFVGLLGWFLARAYDEKLFYLFFLTFILFGYWIPLVLRALEKKPELRFQQASVLKTQVETIASTKKPDNNPRFSLTAIVVGVVGVLALSAAIVAVKVSFFPDIKEDLYFQADYRHFQNLPSGLFVLRSTHFRTPTDGLDYSAETSSPTGEHITWMMGRNRTFVQFVTRLYNCSSNKVVWPAIMPEGRFDYLFTMLDSKAQERFGTAVKEKLGLELVPTNMPMKVLVVEKANVTDLGVVEISSPTPGRGDLGVESLKSDYIGQTNFPFGDSIEITSVERNENQMTVRGHYNLVSHDNASLAFYISSTNSPDFSQSSAAENPAQVLQIVKGRGDFELIHLPLISGLPHINMYGDDTGKPFAEIYFGNKAEADEESMLDLNNEQTEDATKKFGPVIERVINLESPGSNSAIDLDSGKFVSLASISTATSTTNFDADSSRRTEKFLQENGVDAIGTLQIPILDTNTQMSVPKIISVNGLMCVNETVAKQIDESNWNVATADWLMDHANNFQPRGGFFVMSGTGDLPKTYLFKTHESTGILQITDFTENPRGVKIRYKLVQNANQSAEVVSLTSANQAPVVVETFPMSGARDVAPGETEIRVRFSKEMENDSWSWSSAWQNSDPQSLDKPHYEADHKTCVMKVKLEAGKTYGYWINSQNFHNFKDAQGHAAVPYLLTFKTSENLLQVSAESPELLAAQTKLAEIKKEFGANSSEASKQQRTADELASAAGDKKASQRLCIGNLRQLDAAKNMWALENKKQKGDLPTIADLLPYLGRNQQFPVCPDGGNYIINPIGEAPTCSIPGHVIPNYKP